jgi:putative spermidine/putrescine transport system ATP-binding protein
MTEVSSDARVASPSSLAARERPAIELVHLRKEFGEVVAVDDVDLTIRQGEFFSMLGPSGSGKTTVLRMIAGFEVPSAGAVLLAGRDVSHLAAYDRDVNTVFQDYALFPHMDVRENVEYGLRVKRVGKAERRRRALDALASVRLQDLAARRPAQLSGGQRQRVALARALVNRPQVLLLDEPLGALDLKLREEMQVELKAIQHEVGITFVFVTHDQHEALSMSDRVAVFDHGRIEQVGAPREVYERPESLFVAGFVGTTNVLRDDVAERVLGRGGLWTVRPERIRIGPPGQPVADDEVTVTGQVHEVLYLGADTRYVVVIDGGGSLVATRHNVGTTDDLATPGLPVQLSWRREHAFALADPTDAAPAAPAATLPTDQSMTTTPGGATT